MAFEVITRAFHAEDYAAVVQLWEQTEGVEVAEGDDRATIIAYLQRNPGLSRVATIEGRIVGAVLCGHDGRRGLVYHLAVSDEQRGLGLGGKLVEECREGLRGCGIKRALLLVADENTAGRAFWEASGFEQIPDVSVFGADL